MNWRPSLGVPEVGGGPQMEVGAGLNRDRWAGQELGDAPLGDRCRSARLVQSVTRRSQDRSATPPRDLAAQRGFYRFIEKVEDWGDHARADAHAPSATDH